MKPLLENRQVECLLSLIVIVYALRWAIPYTEAVIQEIPIFDKTSYLNIWLGLSQIAASCLLIVFFPRVVQWIGYFATSGKSRSKRRWFSREILAIPLILYAFTECIWVFLNIVYLLSAMVMALFVRDTELFSLLNEWSLTLLVYFGFAVVVLFNARYIAVWLLRISRASPGIAKNSTIK